MENDRVRSNLFSLLEEDVEDVEHFVVVEKKQFIKKAQYRDPIVPPPKITVVEANITYLVSDSRLFI